MERQIHGFNFQDKYIKENLLKKEEKYTAPFDAYDNKGTPYQIKTIKKNNSIDLGDYFINSKKEKDFYLVIGFWESEKTNIVRIDKLLIKADKWRSFLHFEKAEELKDWIRNKVSNSKSYDKIWRKEINDWKKLYGNKKIKLRFKRDSKTQRRIQCAINKKEYDNYFRKEFLVE